MKLFIGIDPGLSGAVAALDEKGDIVGLQDTPVLLVKNGNKKRNQYVESAMATIISNLLAAAGDAQEALVTIENVHAMPKQGVSSSFNFGAGFGIWLGICAALRAPIQRVEPVVWKRAYGLVGKDKAAAVVAASRLHPRAELYTKRGASMDGRADALLLASWASKSIANYAHLEEFAPENPKHHHDSSVGSVTRGRGWE